MSDDIYEVAALWHQAQARDDMDWDAFASWLDADPRHRDAYDDIALLDDDLERSRPAIVALLPANDPEPLESGTSRRPLYLAMAGVAAVLLAILTIGLWRDRASPATNSYVAAAGRTRTIEAARGATAVLAAGSRLDVTTGRPLKLDGTAWFDVQHDPARPLTISVPGYEIRDVGTRFDVSSDGRNVRVAVAQGQVAITATATGQRLEVAAGQAAIGDSRGTLERIPAVSAAIGAWRNGRFVYDQVPLSLVAADIARYTGKPVLVDDRVAGQRFSGILAPGDRDSMVAAVRQLTGVNARREGNAVRLGDGTGG